MDIITIRGKQYRVCFSLEADAAMRRLGITGASVHNALNSLYINDDDDEFIAVGEFTVMASFHGGVIIVETVISREKTYI